MSTCSVSHPALACLALINILLVTIGIYTPLYSFSLFLPTIVKTLGYADNKAQVRYT